jgi:hypothetical protein
MRDLTLAVGGPGADRMSLVLLALAVGGVGVIMLRDHPKLLAVLWLCGICFVPIWMGVTVKVYLAPVAIIAVFVFIALFPVPGLRLGKADVAIILLIALCTATVVVGGATRAAISDVVLQWVPPLMMGRLLTQRVGLNWMSKAIGVVFAVAAALAIVEFFTGFNPFVLLARQNSLYGTWGGLQARGGIVRAEGAFGHSIALGASLAAALPLVIATDMVVKAKSVVVLLLLSGTIVTFSRAGMICAVLGLILTIVFQRQGLSLRLRVLLTAVLAGVTVAVLPSVSRVFEVAGSEAAGSAAYRGDLLSLVPDMIPLGLSPASYRAPDGTLYMRYFKSIDSALILEGLTYGWLPLALTVALLLAAVVLVLTRLATAPTIALVAQIPALATVALITQYPSVLWFIVGMAIVAERHEAQNQDEDASEGSAGVTDPAEMNGSGGVNVSAGVSDVAAGVISTFAGARERSARASGAAAGIPGSTAASPASMGSDQPGPGFGHYGQSPLTLRGSSSHDPVAEMPEIPSSDASGSIARGRASAPNQEGSGA